MKRLIIVAVLLVVFAGVVFPASFGAFGGISKGFNFTPTFTLPFDPLSLDLDLVSSYGFCEDFDLIFSFSKIGLSFSPFDFAWNGVWGMPRYDFGGFSILNYNILALYLGFDGGFGLGVQYHTELSLIKEILHLEFNAIFDFIPNINLGGIVAPVLYLSKVLNLPLALYFESDFSVLPNFRSDLILGLYWEVSQRVQVSLGYNFTGSVVGWLNFAF